MTHKQFFKADMAILILQNEITIRNFMQLFRRRKLMAHAQCRKKVVPSPTWAPPSWRSLEERRRVGYLLRHLLLC
jgi:hypothetical protein